jgi:hypothetical protein
MPRAAASVVAAAVSCANAAEPTAFERFATDPGTAVEVVRDLGSLTSVDATVRVTLLVGAARIDNARMRGVRFELRNNGGVEQVYLDELQLEQLLGELDLMGSLKDEAFSGRTAGMQVLGTESCWMPTPALRILCPEVQRAPAWSGLRLWTFGGALFEFRDRTSADLRALVARAATALGKL